MTARESLSPQDVGADRDPVWQFGTAADDLGRRDEPWARFSAWMAEAAEPCDANTMAFAAAGADGLPDMRIMLLKGYDARGFVFFTHAGSAKGEELARNPQAALVLQTHEVKAMLLRGRAAIAEGGIEGAVT